MIEKYRPMDVTHDFGDFDLDLQGHTGLQTTKILAHLWGAYAIPVALYVVRCVSSVSTITT